MFEIIWQADIHASVKNEAFATEAEALENVEDLKNNMRRMGGKWIVEPQIKR